MAQNNLGMPVRVVCPIRCQQTDCVILSRCLCPFRSAHCASPPSCPFPLTRHSSKARCTAVVRRVTVTGGAAKGKSQLDVDSITAGPTAAEMAVATTPTLGTTSQENTSAAAENAKKDETKSSAQPSRPSSDLEKEKTISGTHAKKEDLAKPSGKQPAIGTDMTKGGATSVSTNIAKGKGVAKPVTDKTTKERTEASKAAVEQKPVVAGSGSSSDGAVKPPATASVDIKEGVADVSSKMTKKTSAVSPATKKKNVADPETTAAEKVCSRRVFTSLTKLPALKSWLSACSHAEC